MTYLLLLDVLVNQALHQEHVFRDCTYLFDETDEWLQITSSTAHGFVQ